jgi:hypothetical protein
MAPLRSRRFQGLVQLERCLDGARMTPEGFDANGDLVVDQPNHRGAVTAVQQALADLHYALDVDGSYGPGTAAVVQQFKNEQGLALPPGMVAHDGVTGRGTMTRLDELFAAEQGPRRFMVGTVGVQLVLVAGPGDAAISTLDDLWIRYQVVTGLRFLSDLARGNDPPIPLTFQTQVRRVDLAVVPSHLPLLDHDPRESEYRAREDLWRDPAQVQLGHPAGVTGLRSLVQAGAVDQSVVLFVTGYPLAAQAYADYDDPYVCVDWGWVQDTSRGGKGIGFLGHIVAHEVGHAFGAPDEYSPCTLLQPDGKGWGALDVPNLNCVDANPDAVVCLMRRGRDVEAICAATRAHWGWVDNDRNGVLDVLE